MICINRLFVCFISLVHIIVALKIVQNDEKAAIQFLESLNKKSAEIASKLVSAQWEFETQNSRKAKKELFQATSDAIKNAKTSFQTVVTSYPWMSYVDPDIRRQLKLYSEIGMLALPDDKYLEFQQIMSDLEVMANNTTVCDYYNRTKCDLHLHPDIHQKLETSLNLGEISYLWTEWKRATESKLRQLLDKYVNLLNQAAILNNYKNYKEYSLRNIEMDNPKQEMENLWESVKPLYEQIHAYVRRKLRNVYGEKTVSQEGAIPAQLLGCVWCENWSGIAQKLVPFPEEDSINFTEIMINKSYTPESVRNLAENYFMSMNFTVPHQLWYNETLKEHFGGICHPRIFNFYNNDVRIKDCGKVSLSDYLEDIRLLAKAEYMFQFSHQPFIYQAPADPGLEIAVSDILTLSASTFNNLKRQGLYNKEITDKIRLNRLFKIALEKITAIPFLMVQEFWRWDIFSGKSIDTAINGLNELREKLQGISPFTEDLIFNSGEIGTVFSKISLAHHFFSYFFEFQMYESFCPTSELPPMDDCSFWGKIEVRDSFRYIMSMGSSKSLKEIQTILLGQDEIKPKSILNYFEPLMNWLKRENEKTGEIIGWSPSNQFKESRSTKHRRKRSLDYLEEEKQIDSDKTSSKEPDRFQHLMYKRSKNKLDESKQIERERKSARNEREDSEEKGKNSLIDEQRSSDLAAREALHAKKRRSMRKNIDEINNSKEEEENQDDNAPLSNECTLRNVKCHSDSETSDGSKIVEKRNGQILNSYNSRNSKRRSEYESFDDPYGSLKMYVPEKGENDGESLFTSRYKKRHSDSTSFDEPRESSYVRATEKRNAEHLSDLEFVKQPQYTSNLHKRTEGGKENNDHMYSKFSSRKAKRHSDSFDLTHQNSNIYKRTSGKDNDDCQMVNKYAPKKAKRRSDSQTVDQSNDNSQLYSRTMEKGNNVQTPNHKYTSFDEPNTGTKTYARSLSNKERSAHEKRSESGLSKNSESESDTNLNTAASGSISKIRYERRAGKKQRLFTDDETETFQSHQIRRRKDKIQSENERLSRNAKWHTDTKKDISRLLHSMGFAVENDEKDKIKELKKKLKGDSNLKDAIENSYENMIDFNGMKSGIGRSDGGEEKGRNKFWAMNNYLTDSTKMMQSPSNLNKKGGMLNSHLSDTLISKSSDEKSVGKKDTSVSKDSGIVSISTNQKINGNSESHFTQSSDNTGRGTNGASFQAFLQGNYAQKQINSANPGLAENRIRSEMSQINQQMHRGKGNSNQFSSGFPYKYLPLSDMNQYKDSKEFREASSTGSNKSPYIIIVGQLTPEMREKLMQEKEASFVNFEKQPFFQGEKKQSDKRSRESGQIYVLPVDTKSSELNLMKPNLYAEHEHEAGHDPNTERDQESEEEQLRLEDKSNFYRAGKESPSEYLLSWNNDKNRKIVKRSKREHNKDTGEDNFKLLRLAPMKDSFLEGLLGKSLNQANLDDKNVQVLIHDGFLNGNSEYSPSANADSSGTMGMQDQSQAVPLQPTSSLSSLASSVISALSPRGYSHVSKASSHRQDSDLEEDSSKEADGTQAFGKEQKEQELPFLLNSNFRCNNLLGKKKAAKLYSDDETRKLIDMDPAAKGTDACCKKIILTPCPPKCPSPCPCPCPCPCPSPLPCPIPCPSPCPCPLPCPPCPCPSDDCKCPCPPPFPCPCPSPCPCPCPGLCPCPGPCPCPDICCKKPSECSLVNCQFKITKAKKPHERLTIMIYDRINPPTELPEPYDALAVISEILQRIQCCSCKPCSQLTEEDPDYPANDNMDQLKGSENEGQDSKNKVQVPSGEIPIMGNENPEEEGTDDSGQNAQQTAGSSDEDKYQPREKATPALDQLTVFNKDKLKPVFIELRKIDDILQKRSQQE